ncbi:MAG: iron chelate uptake ABC transporter family permease subunit [Methanomicrobia archaeon]|nr:iron chelate uptake ABC transporter family permease subunit [Methanomicrobia archaeon]
MKTAPYFEKIVHWKLVMLYLLALLGVSIVLTTAIGPVYVPPLEIVALLGSKLGLCEVSSTPHEIIIFQIRLPRIFLGLLVGLSLATAGTAMQGLFKNPMADPYIIGIASGAAVGAALSMLVLPQFLSVYTRPLMAFLGALGTIFLVYNIAKVGGRIPVDTLLLTGIAVSLFLGAVLSFMMSVAGESLHNIFFWIMGGFWLANWTQVKIIVLPILVTFGLIYLFAKDLNAMLLGEESARTLGINVEHAKQLLLILSAFITAAAVTFTGTIGFVGLIIPHITRILVGPDHRILIPASALMGGIFLVWTDALARLLGELPVGILTAFFGAPFFIYLLKKRKSGYYAA